VWSGADISGDAEFKIHFFKISKALLVSTSGALFLIE
jgi:hypothetical protein